MNTPARSIPSLLALIVLLPAVALAVQDADLAVGDGFQLGGVFFSVAEVGDDGVYYRVSSALGARDAGDHPDCFREASTFYHHESCPLLRAHFAHYSADSAPIALTSTATGSGGNHPIDYLRGNYQPRQDHRPWGGWYGGWGLWSGGRFGSRPGRGRGFFLPRPTPFHLGAPRGGFGFGHASRGRFELGGW